MSIVVKELPPADPMVKTLLLVNPPPPGLGVPVEPLKMLVDEAPFHTIEKTNLVSFGAEAIVTTLPAKAFKLLPLK